MKIDVLTFEVCSLAPDTRWVAVCLTHLPKITMYGDVLFYCGHPSSVGSSDALMARAETKEKAIENLRDLVQQTLHPIDKMSMETVDI